MPLEQHDIWLLHNDAMVCPDVVLLLSSSCGVKRAWGGTPTGVSNDFRSPTHGSSFLLCVLL